MVRNFEKYCKDRYKSLKKVFKRDKVKLEPEFARDIIKDEVMQILVTTVIKESEIKNVDKILKEIIK